MERQQFFRFAGIANDWKTAFALNEKINSKPLANAWQNQGEYPMRMMPANMAMRAPVPAAPIAKWALCKHQLENLAGRASAGRPKPLDGRRKSSANPPSRPVWRAFPADRLAPPQNS